MQNPLSDMEREEQITVDPNYLRSFNNGYLLARHEPELASKLIDGRDNPNEYFKGFISGKSQYDKEALEWAKGFSRGAPERNDMQQQQER